MRRRVEGEVSGVGMGSKASGTGPHPSLQQRPPQRVRHQAREALAVMAFSAAASVGLTSTLVLLSGLAR